MRKNHLGLVQRMGHRLNRTNEARKSRVPQTATDSDLASSDNHKDSGRSMARLAADSQSGTRTTRPERIRTDPSEMESRTLTSIGKDQINARHEQRMDR